MHCILLDSHIIVYILYHVIIKILIINNKYINKKYKYINKVINNNKDIKNIRG